KATDDRLRGYPTWLSSRNLSNEASDESVQALIEAVRANYDICQRWYRLKADILGLDRLADYDRNCSAAPEDERYEWPEAQDIVLTSFREFSPVLHDTVKRFFDEPWIDAPVRPGKRGGAFCAYAVPSVHPYVMLNYTSRRRDVLTLAHELGHGMHASLARPRGVLEQHTPLTLAQTASVFGVPLVVRGDPRVRPPARRRGPAGVALVAAGRDPRRRCRDGLPPGRDEPVRGPRPHDPPRGGRAERRALQRAVGALAARAVRRL